MIESWIDIPNLQTVKLLYSFRYVQSKSITSIIMNNHEWIDVSTILADLFKISVTIHNPIELREMNTNIDILVISSNSCNELNSLNLNEYRYLKSIEIGNDCFMNVDIFNIDGLNELKSLKIGKNSFTRNWYKNDPNRSFHVLNCIELESIEIDRYSFSDYGGGFELVNLPKLSTIKIGDIETNNWSRNFYYSSFVIKGMMDDVILNRSS